MKLSDAVMNLLARHGIRHLFHDRSAFSPEKASLLAAAARSGIAAEGMPDLALAEAAAEGCSAASGLAAAVIGTSASPGGSATLQLVLNIQHERSYALPPHRAAADRALLPFQPEDGASFDDDALAAGLYDKIGKALCLAARAHSLQACFRLDGIRLERDADSLRLRPFEESDEYWELLASEPPIRDADLDRLIDGLRSSRRPLLAVGADVRHSGAAAELRQLLDLTGIAAAASLGGLDSLPSGSPLNLGLADGCRHAKPDLVLALGCSSASFGLLRDAGGRLIRVNYGSCSHGNPEGAPEFNSDPRLFLTALCSRLQAAGFSDSEKAIRRCKPRSSRLPAPEALQQPDLLVVQSHQPGLVKLLSPSPLRGGQRLIPIAGGPERAAAAALGAMIARPDRTAALIADRRSLSAIPSELLKLLASAGSERLPRPLPGSRILLLPLRKPAAPGPSVL
ncbi:MULTISPECIES: hypothetical protein [unclassified Paenibacillus]|uniref:hypothetical protein n=1 Tax=unclassified Paenibacillus TaxID=185978 RepID=UPI000953F8D3|nr:MULTISPECIES: hypothetical protein [unclassified Paenibacillus]ASS68489.1 hypothetical protein CIC07_21890 [Paenibacillus sp. RUD330]SIR35144.1 Acetolactate synthase large subunit [Paenibacillus sp. RU4X]SIR45880.1 Acetolactate synthase large subunit [Paenibacillus sp. RU4T]